MRTVSLRNLARAQGAPRPHPDLGAARHRVRRRIVRVHRHAAAQLRHDLQHQRQGHRRAGAAAQRLRPGRADVALVPKLRAAARRRTSSSRPSRARSSWSGRTARRSAPTARRAWAATGPPESVNPIPTFVSGHAPAATDEVVLNKGAADQHDIATGDHVKIVTSNADVVSAIDRRRSTTPTSTPAATSARCSRATRRSDCSPTASHYSTVNLAARARRQRAAR